MLKLILILISIKFIYNADFNSSELCKCENFKSKPKILNGQLVDEQDLKFMATIRYIALRNQSNSNDGFYFINICSAVILDSFYLLTTASCLDFIDSAKDYLGNFRIGAGPHYLTDVFENETFYRMIDSYYYNPKRIKNSFEYDLGIIKLNEPFELGKNILPACFLDQKDFKDENLYLSGWGTYENELEMRKRMENINGTMKLNKNSKNNDFLKNVNIFDDDFLGNTSELKVSTFKQIKSDNGQCDSKSDHIICALNQNSGCYGDEGSPLIYILDNKLYVVGLMKLSPYEYTTECLSNLTNLFVTIKQLMVENNFRPLLLNDLNYCFNKDSNKLVELSTTNSNNTSSESSTKFSENLTTQLIFNFTVNLATTKKNIEPIQNLTTELTTMKIDTEPIKNLTTELKTESTTMKIDTETTKNLTTEFKTESTTMKIDTEPIKNSTELETISTTMKINTETTRNLTTESKTELTTMKINTEPIKNLTTEPKIESTTSEIDEKTFESSTEFETESTATKIDEELIKNITTSLTTELLTGNPTTLSSTNFNQTTSASNLKKENLLYILPVIVLFFLIFLYCCCKSKSKQNDSASLVSVVSLNVSSKSSKLKKKSSSHDKESLSKMKPNDRKLKSTQKLKKKRSKLDKKSTKEEVDKKSTKEKVGKKSTKEKVGKKSTKEKVGKKPSNIKSESQKSIGGKSPSSKSLDSKSISVTSPSIQSTGTKSVASMPFILKKNN